MPLPSLVKPILLTSSIVIGASVALYETNPHVRHFVDTATLKLTHIFQDLLFAIDEGLNNLTPEQREEHRRRQRERVSMVAMGGRSTGGETAISTRGNGVVSRENTGGGVGSGRSRGRWDVSASASGRQDLRAQRRRLWELAEAPPAYPKNDSAVEIAPPLPERPKDDGEASAQQQTQDQAPSVEQASPPAEQKAQPQEPVLEAAAATTLLFEQEVAGNSAEPIVDEVEDAGASSDYSGSLIATPQYSPSLSAASWSQPPSPAPEDLVDALSSMDEDDGASTDTETMSHVSAYSFGSAAGSLRGEADVISLASSDAGDLERDGER